MHLNSVMTMVLIALIIIVLIVLSRTTIWYSLLQMVTSLKGMCQSV